MERPKYLHKIEFQFEVHPICGILGPRQVGKTTLAKMYSKQHFPKDTYFLDLENPEDLTKLDNPMVFLENIAERLIVIDEIQFRPNLFPILRVLVDKDKNKHKFLILGSASRHLIRQSSESLAGRIGYIELPPFSLEEVDDIKKLWVRGGFPLSYLAIDNEKSMSWREQYITNLVQRDIPNLGFDIPPEQMRRFWAMLIHYHGQTFNGSEIAKSLGISNHTVRRYLDILAGTFMIRVLLPWFENLGKRQVKSPKIYIRDTGLLNAFLKLSTFNELLDYPRFGSFWEGFALEEVIRFLQVDSDECFFWATQQEAELDLMISKKGKRIGFEFKYTDAPKITKSMRIAMEDLKLDHLALVYPGKDIWPMDEKITVYGLESIMTGKFLKDIL